jgi:hypothetical protein
MTNKFDVCLRMGTEPAMPTVYHHEQPGRGSVPPETVHAGCYGRASDGIAAWSMMCTGYIVFLGAVHGPFASIHGKCQRPLCRTEILPQQETSPIRN